MLVRHIWRFYKYRGFLVQTSTRFTNAIIAVSDNISIQNLVGNGFPQAYATIKVMSNTIKNKPKKAAVKSINNSLMILYFTGEYFRLNLINKFTYKKNTLV